jgi:D-aminoacyl-tRNA deacylase
MRAVIQRVSSASVTTTDHSASIGRGLLVLVGVERGDGPADVDFIARKIRELRLFESDGDSNRDFDRSVEDVKGSVLVVSQFTLAADCRKGRRPSFDAAAPPDVARPMYDSVVAALRQSGLDVATGVFQAMMQVSLVNEGPVTVLLDSRKSRSDV